MVTIWLTANYAAEQVRRRLRAVFGDNPDRGALSLEWIVIAVLIVGAATGAAALFVKAISDEAGKLP
jgi:hypothetical protein